MYDLSSANKTLNFSEAKVMKLKRRNSTKWAAVSTCSQGENNLNFLPSSFFRHNMQVQMYNSYTPGTDLKNQKNQINYDGRIQSWKLRGKISAFVIIENEKFTRGILRKNVGNRRRNKRPNLGKKENLERQNKKYIIV